MKQILIVLVLSFSVLSCSTPDAQSVIDKTILAYGGERIYRSDIKFDFRDKSYRGYQDGGGFSYERMFQDSTGSFHDVLNNDGFTRTINDSIVNLNEEWIGKYTRSVNSVIYFFRIPFNLNDPAVHKKFLGEATIEDVEYYKIEVTFSENSGGEDFDDVFVYWITQDSYSIDYMAYAYHTDGGGKRMRKLINPREVNGLKVVDWINYEPKEMSVSVLEFDSYMEEGGLKELSRIENKNIEITYLQ